MKNVKDYLNEQRIEVAKLKKRFNTTAAIAAFEAVATSFICGSSIAMTMETMKDQNSSKSEKAILLTVSALATGLTGSSTFKAIKSMQDAIESNKLAKNTCEVIDKLDTLVDVVDNIESENNEDDALNDSSIDTDLTANESDDSEKLSRKRKYGRLSLVRAKFNESRKNKESV